MLYTAPLTIVAIAAFAFSPSLGAGLALVFTFASIAMVAGAIKAAPDLTSHISHLHK